jgi:hypothetical protein
MKTTFFAFIFMFSSIVASAQTSIDAFGTKIIFTKPDEKVWTLVKETDPGDGTKGVRIFKHSKITDKKGVSSEPVISMLFEQVPETTNAAAYATVAMKGIEDMQKSLKITWDTLGGYPKYSSDKHSFVYKARYNKAGSPHRIYICYILYNSTGVIITADSSEDVFEQVNADMLAFIKSVVIQ